MPDHKFALKQLQPDATPNYQPHIKLSFYFKKRPDISDEQFHTHWQTIHADLAASSAVFKKYVKRYVQFHALPQWKEKARSFEGFEILDFDGCSEIWVDSFEDAGAFFSSEEYGNAMRDDEGNWLSRPVYVMFGEENLIFGNAFWGGIDGLSVKDLAALHKNASL